MNNNIFQFSPPDERDYVYCGSVSNIPSKFCVKTSNIKHQKGTNHCTAFATSLLLEAIQARVKGELIELSPLFVMKNNKDMDSNPSVTGSYTRVAMESICKHGACLEQNYPHMNLLTNKFPTISKSLYDEAKQYKADKYGQVSRDIQRIKEAIVQNDGVVFAIEIFPSYADTVEGFIRPSGGEIPTNGHAILCAGYDDTLAFDFKDGKGERKGFFILQESYGENNIETYKGYRYLSYDCIRTKDWDGKYSSDKIIREIWTATDNDKLQSPNFHINNPSPVKEKINMKFKLGSKDAYINGIKKTLVAAPELVNTTTFLPLRFCGEAFGCDVNYIASEKRIEITHNRKGLMIIMRVGSCIITTSNNLLNKYQTIYAVEPLYVSGSSTMIPIRAFANAFGCNVDYDPKTKEIFIQEL